MIFTINSNDILHNILYFFSLLIYNLYFHGYYTKMFFFFFVRVIKSFLKIEFIKKKVRGFSNLMKIEFCWRLIFLILIWTFPGVMWVPTHNLGPIRSAVLTFIDTNKQTNTQTDRQAKYINRLFFSLI